MFSFSIFNSLVPIFSALFVVVLASQVMGKLFSRIQLPLISGFLCMGIISGPFVLNFISAESVNQLRFLDKSTLAFIAFAAGAELELQVIRGYFRSIISSIGGQTIAILGIGSAAFFLIKEHVPFMSTLSQGELFAVALLGSTIMVARSPSSALGIIKELRAKGPFTHKVLGITVLTDAVVIIVFASSVSLAEVLVKGEHFNVFLLAFVSIEIILDAGVGILIGLLLRTILLLPTQLLKEAFILLIGLGVFWLSKQLHHLHLLSLPISLFSEPLLICLIAGFYMTNFTSRAAEFHHIIERMSPTIFLLFFTLVGLELQLFVVLEAWQIILVLVCVRTVAIFIGCLIGDIIVQDRTSGNSLLTLGFITQAGISIGLAKEIGIEFDESWGPELASLSIGVVVLNQLIGPPLLKWVIHHVGESHTRADSPDFDGIRDVIIFGVESQSVALAKQLESHNWNVVLAGRNQQVIEQMKDEPINIVRLPEISESALQDLNLSAADSILLMLSDEENLVLCELIYEKFGIENVIVRLQDRANFDEFHQLGALAIEPSTAMVNLLDQFVRFPFAATLLLGMDPTEEFMEIEVKNPDLNRVAIRHIHFPSDVLILSIYRQGNRLDSHGYTRLELGDHVAVVGSPDSLAEVEVRFEG